MKTYLEQIEEDKRELLAEIKEEEKKERKVEALENNNKTKMKGIIIFIAGLAGAVAAVDFFGFLAWVASGQTPPDDFYVGVITASVLKGALGL